VSLKHQQADKMICTVRWPLYIHVCLSQSIEVAFKMELLQFSTSHTVMDKQL